MPEKTYQQKRVADTAINSIVFNQFPMKQPNNPTLFFAFDGKEEMIAFMKRMQDVYRHPTVEKKQRLETDILKVLNEHTKAKYLRVKCSESNVAKLLPIPNKLVTPASRQLGIGMNSRGHSKNGSGRGRGHLQANYNLLSTMHMSFEWNNGIVDSISSFYTTGLGLTTLSNPTIVPGSAYSFDDLNTFGFTFTFLETITAEILEGLNCNYVIKQCARVLYSCVFETSSVIIN
jgi:hypothetical protein